MKIALVEDEKYFMEYEERIIKNALNPSVKNLEIDHFYNGTSFLEVFQQKQYYIVFLDIDMPDISGLKVAERIRSFSQKTDIIFVSNKEEFVYDCFAYQPFRFIRKDHSELEIAHALKAFLKKHRTDNHNIIVKFEGETQSVPISEVQYFEIQDHLLIIHTTLGDKNLYGTIGEKEKELFEFHFVRPHVGYLVNLKYITSLNKNNLTMEDGTVIPVSRGRYEQIASSFHQYFTEQI